MGDSCPTVCPAHRPQLGSLMISVRYLCFCCLKNPFILHRADEQQHCPLRLADPLPLGGECENPFRSIRLDQGHMTVAFPAEGPTATLIFWCFERELKAQVRGGTTGLSPSPAPCVHEAAATVPPAVNQTEVVEEFLTAFCLRG